MLLSAIDSAVRLLISSNWLLLKKSSLIGEVDPARFLAKALPEEGKDVKLLAKKSTIPLLFCNKFIPRSTFLAVKNELNSPLEPFP